MKKLLDPVDDFVNMENDLAGDICALVDAALVSLKKVMSRPIPELFTLFSLVSPAGCLVLQRSLLINRRSDQIFAYVLHYIQVLFGSGLLTPAIQSAATSLLSGVVPSDWRRAWDVGPEKPQAWLRDLVSKRISLGKWKAALTKGGSTNLLSAPLCLGDLFNPATFINALRQQTARKLGTAIDLVKMVCSWEKDPRKLANACPLYCTLSNLLLQGADFHSGSLQESSPEAAEMTTTPPVCIGFVPITADDTYAADASVTIPIYLSPTREDVLTELQMPIKGEDQNKWILSGVALFLSGDDA